MMTETTGQSECKDFFISYNWHDRIWGKRFTQVIQVADLASSEVKREVRTREVWEVS